MSKMIINCETNEVEIRELNQDELEQQAKDELANQLLDQQIQEKRSAVLAKLSVLGLTADDLKTLGFQHNL